MKKLRTFLILPLLLFSFSSCELLLEVFNQEYPSTGPVNPSSSEIAGGLKDALLQGTSFAVSTLGQEGGYLQDPKVKIPFPPEAQKVADKIRQIGLGALVDEFETRLNQGAEKGAQLALPIFKNAIQQMTINDAKNILLGEKDAATTYFKTKTSEQLIAQFRPQIKNTLDEVKATEIWEEITTRYNSIPFVKKVETDIVKYATDKALEGLFAKIELEEEKIRNNIEARKTQLLQKVFAYADRQLNRSN